MSADVQKSGGQPHKGLDYEGEVVVGIRKKGDKLVADLRAFMFTDGLLTGFGINTREETIAEGADF